MKPSIVIDSGSHSIKIGFAGQEEPTSIFPSVVGHSLTDGVEPIAAVRRRVGNVARKKPISQDQVNNWEDMELLWKHGFENELKINSADHPVCLSETILRTSSSRSKTAEIMFEKFEVPALYFGSQAMFSLYANGRNDGGLVIDIGYESTRVIPIDGSSRPIISAYSPVYNFGGSDLDSFMLKTLTLQNDEFVRLCSGNLGDAPEKSIHQEIKEKLGYIALDFQVELDKKLDLKVSNFEIASVGEVINISDEKFKCPELIFQHNLDKSMGHDELGLHTLAHNAIMKCEPDLRQNMFENIILCGGSTMFPGISERLTKELKILNPSAPKIRAISNADYGGNMSWIGGSSISSIEGIVELSFVSKKDYEENNNAVLKFL